MHTPGPWKYYHPSELPSDFRIARVGKVTPGERAYVCRLTTSHDPEISGDDGGGLQPPREEDACLIAAAPDLVKVIEGIAGLFCGIDDMDRLDAADFVDNAGAIFRLVVEARAALDKAKLKP